MISRAIYSACDWFGWPAFLAWNIATELALERLVWAESVFAVLVLHFSSLLWTSR
jgi:hypothetical protein